MPARRIAARLRENALIIRQRSPTQTRFVEQIAVRALLFERHVGECGAFSPSVDPPPQRAHGAPAQLTAWLAGVIDVAHSSSSSSYIAPTSASVGRTIAA